MLASGRIAENEGSFQSLADERRLNQVAIPGLGPSIRVAGDLRALVALVSLVRRFRPEIVHTHTAKAGALGRVAALIAGHPRPLIVHTYHGHVLSHYFGRVQRMVFTWIERRLGRRSDCLIGVSEATVRDLIDLDIAASERFRVIPIGLELDRFLRIPLAPNGPLRERLCPEDGCLYMSIGRLVPIKRLDILLNGMASVVQSGVNARLVIVGDGESRAGLEALAASLGLTAYVTFLGFRTDIHELLRAADVAVLSSDDEGTPVAGRAS